MAVRHIAWKWLALAGISIAAATCLLRCQSSDGPAPATDPALSAPPTPSEPESAPLPNSSADSEPASANGPERAPWETKPTRDGTDERIARAKASSRFGEMDHHVLSSVLDLLSAFEADEREKLHQYLASGGQTGTSEHFDHIFNIEGAMAKMDAILERSYVLLPAGEKLVGDVLGDDNIHVVVGPGGMKEGVSLQSYILIDLRKRGRFAEALKSMRGVKVTR